MTIQLVRESLWHLDYYCIKSVSDLVQKQGFDEGGISGVVSIWLAFSKQWLTKGSSQRIENFDWGVERASMKKGGTDGKKDH